MLCRVCGVYVVCLWCVRGSVCACVLCHIEVRAQLNTLFLARCFYPLSHLVGSILCFVLFFYEASLCRPVGLELTEIFLPLPPCWD